MALLLKTLLSSSVIVLDLDDTIYKEAAYQRSGLLEVCRWIEEIYGRPITVELDILLEQGKKDVLGELCKIVALPDSVKQSLLWIYRLHQPKIELDIAIKNTIVELEQCCQGVAILTDGRSITQRLKLRSLGLSHLPVYISEEYGDEKPSPGRFKVIMRNMPADRYVYAADNPKKDFIAPNRLGWITVGVRGDHQSIHLYGIHDLNLEQIPMFWVDNLSKILEI